MQPPCSAICKQVLVHIRCGVQLIEMHKPDKLTSYFQKMTFKYGFAAFILVVYPKTNHRS